LVKGWGQIATPFEGSQERQAGGEQGKLFAARQEKTGEEIKYPLSYEFIGSKPD
jgi:hypothetical protein